MHIFRRVTVLLAACGIAAAGAAGAQQIEARLIGKVLDQSQLALPGVTVNVTSRQTGAVRTVVTGDDGSYTITNLQPGTYVVTFELEGFETRTETIVLGVAPGRSSWAGGTSSPSAAPRPCRRYRKYSNTDPRN